MNDLAIRENETDTAKSDFDERLRKRIGRLYDEGFPFSEMAKKINKAFGTAFTRSAIAGRLCRMGKVSRKTARPRSVSLDALKQKKMRIIVYGRHVAWKKDEALALEVQGSDTVTGREVTLLELGPKHCRWVKETSDDPTATLFCGDPTVEGSWCSHHLKRVRGKSKVDRVSLGFVKYRKTGVALRAGM